MAQGLLVLARMRGLLTASLVDSADETSGFVEPGPRPRRRRRRRRWPPRSALRRRRSAPRRRVPSSPGCRPASTRRPAPEALERAPRGWPARGPSCVRPSSHRSPPRRAGRWSGPAPPPLRAPGDRPPRRSPSGAWRARSDAGRDTRARERSCPDRGRAGRGAPSRRESSPSAPRARRAVRPCRAAAAASRSASTPPCSSPLRRSAAPSRRAVAPGAGCRDSELRDP